MVDDGSSPGEGVFSSSGRAPPGHCRAERDVGPVDAGGAASDPVALPVSKIAECLKTEQVDSLLRQGATAAVVVACGSYNPITNQHLRNMELCRHELTQKLGYSVIGGFLSPVSGAYSKPGLESAEHRVRMAQRAAEESAWIAVDTWEASQPFYVRTVYVLKSIEEEVNHALQAGDTHRGVWVRVVLQCGADMLAAMNDPALWDHKLLHELLSKYQVVCVGRAGVDTGELTKEGTILHDYKQHIHFIEDPFANEVSSSRVRAELFSGRPVDYIIPGAVLRYIHEEELYGVRK